MKYSDLLVQCDTNSTDSSATVSDTSPFNTSNSLNSTPSSADESNENILSETHEDIGIVTANPPVIFDTPGNGQEQEDWNNLSRREERENDRYARKVGIFYSMERGDYVTSFFEEYFDNVDEESVATDITDASSPNYGKNDGHFTFRQMYGQVGQILDEEQEEKVKRSEITVFGTDSQLPQPSPTPKVKANLITPKSRKSMEENNQIIDRLRRRAAQLSVDWGSKEYIAPTLARRLRDFEFAQKKRRKKLGIAKKWGVLGLYAFLSAVREDVEWAEDAARRRRDSGESYLCWSDFISQKKHGSLLRFHNSGGNRPIFTQLILFICTVCLFISIALNGWTFESFSTNPSIGPSAEVLLKMGAKKTNLIVNEFEVWRLITPMFLHGGLIHYFLNCFAIFFVGRAVEKNHGFRATFLLFTVSSIGSTICSALFLPQYISVGASGGIFGLVGSAFADILMNRGLLFSDFINKGQSRRHHIGVVLILIFDILINILLGLTPYTDNFMHVGGMVLGFFCAFTMLNFVDLFGLGRERLHYFSVSQKSFVSQYFGLIIGGVCILVATVVLFLGDGVSNPCDSCSILSCVEFPPWADYENKWYYCDECGGATAMAMRDPATGDFSYLNINCPDGDVVPFSLEGMSKEREWLEQNIPTFCRQKCL